MVRTLFVAVLLSIAVTGPAFAQRDRLLVEPSPPAEWGIVFAFTPKWNIKPGALADLAGIDQERLANGRSALSGTDWSLGFARGRAAAGDWGVSFVQQRIRRGSVIDRVYPCEAGTARVIERCSGEIVTFDDVTVIGPEFHLNVPFVTIKQRVQVGLGLGGGIGVVRGRGTVERYVPTNSGNANATVAVTRTEGPIDAVTDSIFTSSEPWAPFARIEPGVAVLVSPQVKVSVSAGFNYPGTTYLRIGTTYFFPRAAP